VLSPEQSKAPEDEPYAPQDDETQKQLKEPAEKKNKKTKPRRA